MKCAAVIPCFNEDKTIAPLILALRPYVNRIVVVDDGSTDETASNARSCGTMVIRHDSNRGKGAALQTGLSRVLELGFTWAVTLDGDGQHDPVELPRLVRRAEETGAPLIIGNRMPQARAMPWLRRRVNRWMSRKLSLYTGRSLPDTQSGFRLIHLETWASLPLKAQRFEIESDMLLAFLMANHPVEFVPIRVIPAARQSRIHPVSDSWRWWQWWRVMKKNSAHHPETGIGAPKIIGGLKNHRLSSERISRIGVISGG